ncbi:T9SS type A sorting domain-containing protein [Winogradskyella eckloniae]|uniref:T9SS type A sorting domain-containing protein n=1 Tax=Winogradskyella eckloniae TaxID=1089306 RepID=UPI001565578B|nr:T9SS type A sorting domain-containing protein [Winogradskyella eckloniae]NRD19153.1 T9SS type A sorting domain-containing protein [Winogradskyella eckloniae]
MKKIYFLFIAVLISSISFGQNLLVNGDFETWTDTTTPNGWTKAENITQETTEFHGGANAAKHTADGTKDLSQTVSGITPGNMYTISLWYKVESGDDTDARIWSYWRDASDTNITDNAAELRGPDNGYFDTNGNQWAEYTVTLTAPATAAAFYFEVRSYGSAVVYWDDFSFVEQAVTTPTLTITSPADGDIIDPGTTSVNLSVSVLNFSVGATSGGFDGHIHWTVNGAAQPMKYDTNDETIAVANGGTYVVYMELVDNSHTPISPAVNTTITFSVASENQVADITALRAGTVGSFYELTGEAIISYIVTEGTRNQKYIQDGGAGILIDDTAGTLSTVFNIGDGITGLTGELTEYAGTLQFVPSENIAAASSTGTVLTPIVVSASELINNGEVYESRLITLNNVTFSDTGSFTDNTNYDVADGADVTVARVAFGDEDIIGTAIPTTVSSITGLGGEFNGVYQIFPRYASDIAAPLSVNNFNANTFSLYPNPTNTGSVSISSTNNEVIAVQVFDILGKEVKNQTLTNNTLNVSNLISGVYIVKITQNNASTTKKLVIN